MPVSLTLPKRLLQKIGFIKLRRGLVEEDEFLVGHTVTYETGIRYRKL